MTNLRKTPQKNFEFRCYMDEGKKKTQMGYVYLHVPNHPAATKAGYVMEHRLVMEQHLGRYLTGVEEVHHINEVKDDNRIENLLLFQSRSSHLHFHHLQTAKRYDPAVVKEVLEAAGDPDRSLGSVGSISPPTVAKICRAAGVEWVSASRKVISEELVCEALQGRSIAQAAKILGVKNEWLYRHHPDKIKKRNSPGFLDTHREQISTMTKSHTLQKIADLFGSNRQSVAAALARWGETLDESAVRDKMSRATRQRTRNSSGQFCEPQEPPLVPPSS